MAGDCTMYQIHDSIVEKASKKHDGTPAEYQLPTSPALSNRMAALLSLVLTCALLFAKFVLAHPTERQSAPSRYIFLFGDSYTATGYNTSVDPQPSTSNPLGNPGYPGTRTSGGDVWIDVVARNLTGTVVYNLAHGANVVSTDLTQIGSLAAGPPVQDFRDQEAQFETALANNTNVPWTAQNSVFIGWFGINDVSVQIYQGRNYSVSTAILTPDINQYFALLNRQYALGARNFITILVPPIYRAPVYGYGKASNAPALQNLTAWWNSQMNTANNRFRFFHRSAKSLLVDPSTVFNTILDNPQTYGAPNNTCYSYPQGQPCLWDDFIHPGIVLQREFGNRMVTAIKSWK